MTKVAALLNADLYRDPPQREAKYQLITVRASDVQPKKSSGFGPAASRSASRR
jgi:hypothetical protein